MDYVFIIVALLLFIGVGYFLYNFNKDLSDNIGTLKVYVTMISIFVLAGGALHVTLFFMSDIITEHGKVIHQSITFLEEMVKIMVGALIGALVPTQLRKKNDI